MVTLQEPTVVDMPYIAKLWADARTMEDVGGVHILNEEGFVKTHNKLTKTKGSKLTTLENMSASSQAFINKYNLDFDELKQ